MSNKFIKMVSSPLLSREMQVVPTMKYYHILPEWLQFLKSILLSLNNYVEKL